MLQYGDHVLERGGSSMFGCQPVFDAHRGDAVLGRERDRDAFSPQGAADDESTTVGGDDSASRGLIGGGPHQRIDPAEAIGFQSHPRVGEPGCWSTGLAHVRIRHGSDSSDISEVDISRWRRVQPLRDLRIEVVGRRLIAHARSLARFRTHLR